MDNARALRGRTVFRGQVDLHLSVQRLSHTAQKLERSQLSVFQSGDAGLAGADLFRQFCLGRPFLVAQFDQLTDESELLFQCFVLGPKGRLLHLCSCLLVHYSPLLFQKLGHPTQRHLDLIVCTIPEKMQ
jgi:hypothetical protein